MTSVVSCPVCCYPMKEVPWSAVMIDVCIRCKGVWLDRGELEKIIDFENSKALNSGPVTLPLNSA